MLRKHIDGVALLVIALIFLAAGSTPTISIANAAIPIEARNIVANVTSLTNARVCPFVEFFK